MPYNPIPGELVPEGHADPEGDVIFLLDTEHTLTNGQYRSLKVSSHILSRASPVFKAMFDPRFTGGAELSSANPREMRLPEDDCQATIWLCFALHSQDLPEGRMPLVLLKKLALLCDQYDCARALQPRSRLWLHEWTRLVLYDNYWDLLWISYALGDHQTFWDASQRLVYGWKVKDPSFDEDSLDAIGLSLLPTQLPESINAQRTKAAQNLHKTLEQIKGAYLAQIDTCGTKHVSKAQCNRYKLVGHFDKELERLGLVPGPPVVEEKGVSSFLFTLHDLERCILAENTKCTSPDSNFGLLDVSLIYRARDAILGLCMICVRRGKLSASQHSFSAGAGHVDEDVLEAETGKRKLLEYLIPAPRRRRGTHIISKTSVEVEKGSEDVGDNNCMSSTRRQHQQREGQL